MEPKTVIGPQTLQDWIAAIEREVMFVGVKPYSHNIISLALQAISLHYGTEAANKAIEDQDLERLGWHKIESEEELEWRRRSI